MRAFSSKVERIKKRMIDCGSRFLLTKLENLNGAGRRADDVAKCLANGRLDVLPVLFGDGHGHHRSIG